jgi:ABC-type nickel/cobalt efflux system permease component RcnA
MRRPAPIRRSHAAPRLRTALALFGAAFLLMVVLDAAMVSAFAQQTGPFGVPRTAAPPPDGLTGWIMAKQAQYYRSLSSTIRAAKTDGSALLVLFALSFGYGVFHAAGPGHGKAVISSYLIANDEAWRRGIVLSFASALLQALVAVAVVGVAAILLNATASAMKRIVDVIEVASYALIAALGAWLLWTKGRGLVAALRASRAKPRAIGAAATHDHAYHHDHAHEHADHGHAHGHAHHHDYAHVHDAHCGHSHGPDPKDLAGPGGWRRGLSAIVAVGARPCSGAILILVFTLAQGIFWAGIAATFIMALGTAITVAAMATLAVSAKALAVRYANANSAYGAVALRGIEVAAALFVLAFGVLLLMGYMASERLMGV